MSLDSGIWSCLLVPRNTTEDKTAGAFLLRDKINTEVNLDRTELNLNQG